ncbi:MAG: ABC transporter ATP-binding protein [Deltaproteobacteria bacterium]|nr:ABC transporter ATP-binding protein [Deltaproteobacteria bacterium]
MARKVLPYVWPYRLPFLVAVGQVLLLAGLEMLKPWPLKIVIDNVLTATPLPWGEPLRSLAPPALLLVAVTALVGTYVLLGAVSVWNNYTTISIGQGMVNDLRSQLYGHLQRLSLAFHSSSSVGDLIYRVTADTYAIQTLAMNGFFPILSAVALLGGMFTVMVRMDWYLTLIALGICPLLVLTIAALNRRMSAMAMQARERESAVYQQVQRGMAAIKVVQAFSREADEHRTFVNQSSASLRSSLKLYTFQTAYSAATSVVLAGGTALVVWVAAQHVWAGTLSVGQMVVFVSYLASLYGPLNSIIQTYGMIHGAKAGVVRVFEILDTAAQVPDGTRELPRAVSGRGAQVRFSGVEFAYRPDRTTLRGVDFSAEPGQVIAIVGATGAGKSTLVSLIPRFYDVTGGSLSVDGVDVRELRLASLRRRISMVLQPPMVFPISIRENIAYSAPSASDGEVERAARLAQAHEFIQRLPERYDTVIGEAGVTLSEGERQRLTIARALLRNTPILILDEPTSSVDASTEAAIMEGLEALMAGRTTFVIAHRLSTVRRADMILVLSDGEIIERGGFNELVARRGAFYTLYAKQFGINEPATPSAGAGVV